MSAVKTAREASWDFLIEHNINSLPVEPRPILDALKIELISGSEMSRRFPEFSWLPGRKSCAFIADKKRVIAITDGASRSEARVLVMKEIAHFELGHLDLHRRMLDSSANYFAAYENSAYELARRILCPSIVLHDCQAYSCDRIAALCGVTAEFAKTVGDHLAVLLKRNRFRENKLEAIIESRFEEFININKPEEWF